MIVANLATVYPMMAPLSLATHESPCVRRQPNRPDCGPVQTKPHERRPTMKLYYSPGACSLAPHIALVEAGLAHDLQRVDLASHRVTGGGDYYAINPKGYVPVLELDDGTRLTEAAVVLQYIADRKPGTLAPAFGTPER